MKNPHEIEFSKDRLDGMIMYDLKLGSKFKKAFKYISSKLKVNPIPEDLEELNWLEGKSYDWVVIGDDDVTLIIRKYGSHFTIFSKIIGRKAYDDPELQDYFCSRFGCFTYQIDFDKVLPDDKDKHYENSFYDLNLSLPSLMQFLKEKGTQSLWNDYSFKRPSHVKIQNVWDGHDHIFSIDLFVFACEELFRTYHEIVSKFETAEKLKEFKIGDKFSGSEISGISLKENEDIEDHEYHSVGLTLKDKSGKESFKDVFSLTAYYFKDVFPETCSK